MGVYHELRTRYAGEIEGCDISYRCLLWQGIDHLLAIGHGFAYIRRGQDTTGMQVLTLVRLIGQADEVGMAFGIELATMLNSTDRPDLQRRRGADGIDLGDTILLRERGLS